MGGGPGRPATTLGPGFGRRRLDLCRKMRDRICIGRGAFGPSGDMMDLPVPKRPGYTALGGRLRGVCWLVARRGSTLLIIFGLRVFYRTIAQGPFPCRRCGGGPAYRVRLVRRGVPPFVIPWLRPS